MYQGPDNARYTVRNLDDNSPIDEIEEFWNGRYLSAGEAAWRIMGYHVTQKTPAVTALPVHLPDSNKHRQYHRVDGSESKLSRLDHYFLRPIGRFLHDNIERDFSTLTYIEYFTIFRLVTYQAQNDGRQGYYLEQPNNSHSPRQHVVQRNISQKHIARLQTIRPTQGELFYLRCILSHRPVMSFLDARTANGTCWSTYQEAATSLGIFGGESEATYAFIEAIQDLRTPAQLRILFIHMLVNDCITTPLAFWNTFTDELCLDFTLQHNNSKDLGLQTGLKEIARLLREYGKTNDTYGLPVAEIYRAEVEHELERWDIHREALADRASQAETMLNSEQRHVYDTILQSVEEHAPLCLFVEGKAGTGKTTAIRAVCDRVRSSAKIVLPMATSAFAAQLYDGGRTVHATFKVLFKYCIM